MMDLSPLLSQLNAVGLNVTGLADAATWDTQVGPTRRSAALLPGGRAFLVIGNGGDQLWQSFLADLRRDPKGLTQETDPLDAYVQRVIRRLDPLVTAPHRWFFAAANAELHLDFRLLAGLAGLGAQSRLGLLIHPSWGTWVGLRAACLIDAELPPPPPASTNPCDGCPAPCVTACPGEAFIEGRWDVQRCSAFHDASDTCERSCAARLACPVGAAHRYPPEQLNYHYHRESGRRFLRTVAGVAAQDDPYEGVGPHWGTWKARVDVKGTA